DRRADGPARARPPEAAPGARRRGGGRPAPRRRRARRAAGGRGRARAAGGRGRAPARGRGRGRGCGGRGRDTPPRRPARARAGTHAGSFTGTEARVADTLARDPALKPLAESIRSGNGVLAAAEARKLADTVARASARVASLSAALARVEATSRHLVPMPVPVN